MVEHGLMWETVHRAKADDLRRDAERGRLGRTGKSLRRPYPRSEPTER